MRIPPPVLAVTIAVTTLIVSRYVSPIWPGNYPMSGLALVLVLLGTGIDLSAKRLFIKHGTTVNPMTPGAVTAFVETGLYRWSRNPMYLGRLLQLLALSLYLASSVGLICVALFIIYLDRTQIPAEERALAGHFPVEFTRYSSRVRRWI